MGIEGGLDRHQPKGQRIRRFLPMMHFQLKQLGLPRYQ